MNVEIKIILEKFPIFFLVLAFLFMLINKKGKSLGEMLTRYLLFLPVRLGGLGPLKK